MRSSSTLVIDLSVIDQNIKKLTESLQNVMVMVKANAYGTDPIFLSKFIKACGYRKVPFLGVSHASEGALLREAGIKLPIFVISAPAYDADLIAEYQLTPAVSSFEEVEALNQAAKKQNRQIAVHLHLDTGMHRLGISKEHAFALYSAIQVASHLQLEGALTHFAAADNPAFDPFTHEQIRLFKHFLDSLPVLPRWIHAANSSGAVRFSLPFCNLARLGLGVVGFGTCLDGVKPALSCATTLVSIRAAKKGESVGYERTYTVNKDNALIGVIACGYYDGFPISLSGKGFVLIRGKQAPLIGMVCMDFMMVDLTHIPEAQIGDEVILFNPQLPAEAVAAWAATDVRELLVGLTTRVKRLWTDPPPLMTLTRLSNETASAK